MKPAIYVNLPVKNLENSIGFFTQLGYAFNKDFTNDVATCMIISDNIFIMLLEEAFFKSFITKEITDTSKSIESIICLQATSRQSVDELVLKAIAAGAKTYKDPLNNNFMYQRSFQDLDGHLWEIMYMDEAPVIDAAEKKSNNLVTN